VSAAAVVLGAIEVMGANTPFRANSLHTGNKPVFINLVKRSNESASINIKTTFWYSLASISVI
jgi:hypothetical protein